MHLTLRQLQIFNAIAECGSTIAAAQRVCLSQSATSAALKELESAVGTPLFDRVGRRLMLNDAGRSLWPAAQGLLERAQELEDSLRTGRGAMPVTLRLAASTTIGNYLLPALMLEYRHQSPQVRIELRIGNTHDAAQAVADFESDIGFIEGPCHQPDLLVQPWLDDEMLIVAAPHHPLAQAASRERLNTRQLRQAPWLLREPGSGTREAVENALLPHLHALPSDLVLGGSEAIKNAVMHGLGISCLSRCVVRDALDDGRLVSLPTTLPHLTRQFSLVRHRNKHLSPALREFLDACARFEKPAAPPGRKVPRT
jgi:DNA-binding transcriptional LysR family regulator